MVTLVPPVGGYFLLARDLRDPRHHGPPANKNRTFTSSTDRASSRHARTRNSPAGRTPRGIRAEYKLYVLVAACCMRLNTRTHSEKGCGTCGFNYFQNFNQKNSKNAWKYKKTQKNHKIWFKSLGNVCFYYLWVLLIVLRAIFSGFR